MAEFRIKDNFLVGMLEKARQADFSGIVYGHKVNEETKKTFGYRPYKGGAGPSEEQVRKRNEALLKALQAKGIKASLKMIDIGADEEIQTVEANGRQAGFDRWGYNSDDSDTLDQASFEEALAYLMGKNESKVNEETIDELADLGGIAEALAKENDMSAEKIKEGAQVEFKEHKESIGGDIKIAAKIAIDHMKEDPEYYAKLAKMEAGKNAEGSATPSVVESKAHESIKKISVEEVKKLFKKVDAKYAELLANTCGSKEEIIEKGKSAGLEISESKVNEDRDKEFIAIYQELLAKGLDKNAAFGMAVLRIAKKYNITEFSKDEPKKMTESKNEPDYAKQNGNYIYVLSTDEDSHENVWKRNRNSFKKDGKWVAGTVVEIANDRGRVVYILRADGSLRKAHYVEKDKNFPIDEPSNESKENDMLSSGFSVGQKVKTPKGVGVVTKPTFDGYNKDVVSVNLPDGNTRFDVKDVEIIESAVNEAFDIKVGDGECAINEMTGEQWDGEVEKINKLPKEQQENAWEDLYKRLYQSTKAAMEKKGLDPKTARPKEKNESEVNEEAMVFNPYERKDSVQALAAIRSEAEIPNNVRPTLSKHLTFSEGAHNKYHYFALFNVGDGHWIAANAYARIGYTPQVDVFYSGNDENVAKEAYQKKLEGKLSKGYEVDESTLNEKIVKAGSKWQVQSHKGKNLGTFDTKEEAKKRLGQVEFFKHKNESKVNEASAHIFKIGEKVVMQSGSPISARFRGIGEVIKVTPLPNVSGGYEIEVKDRNGEIIKTHDNFIKLSSMNEDVAPTGQNPNKYQSIARGIADENEAKKIAMEKKGTVQKDDQDKEGKRFMVVVKESTNEEEKKPVIALFPKAIDFRYIQGKASYKQGTEEYRLLDGMNEELWDKYLNVMAGSGTTVEYDSVNDVFNVENMTGVGESKINEVSFPLWAIIDRNAEHGQEYLKDKDGQLLTFYSKAEARKHIVDVLGPEKGRYQIMPMSDAASQVEARPVGESKVNEEKHEEVKVFELPKCDFCAQDGKDKEAMYDGKTNIGPWANMCKEHFQQYGTGLGLGKGQKLIKDATAKNEGVLDKHYGSRDEKDLIQAKARLKSLEGTHEFASEKEHLRKVIGELEQKTKLAGPSVHRSTGPMVEKFLLAGSLIDKLKVEGINEQEEKFLQEFEAEFSHLTEDAKKALELSATKLKEEAAKMVSAPYAVGNVKKGDSVRIENVDSQSGHLSFDVVESATGKVVGRLSFDSSAEAKEAGWQV